MAKITLIKEQEFEVKFLDVDAGVRYWDDTIVNNMQDSEDGDLIPCKIKDRWCPRFDVDNGKIINWEIGKTA